MPKFGFEMQFNLRKKVTSKNIYISNVEKGVEGSVYVNDEGDFVIKHNGAFYAPIKASLNVKNKDKVFIFNKEESTGIIVYMIDKNNVINYDYPFMTIAPGYVVGGSIVCDKKGNKYFDIRRVYDEIDSVARKEFLLHKMN